MDDMEDKLSSILGNPQMMQQIMSMAQALGASQGEPQKQEEKKPEPPPQPKSMAMPVGSEAAMLQKVYSIARQSGIDKNQQALLRALTPYLSRSRIIKLEKAMRAAKIAGLASTVLGSERFPFLSGR